MNGRKDHDKLLLHHEETIKFDVTINSSMNCLRSALSVEWISVQEIILLLLLREYAVTLF